MAEEGAHGRNAPADRRGRQPRRAQLGEVALELLGRDSCDRPVEPTPERREVPAVSLDGLRRARTRKQREKPFDLGVGMCHA